MGEVVHTSRIKIVREKGPTRRAIIKGFSEPVYYGVHGGIKRFYKVEPDKEHAATLDHTEINFKSDGNKKSQSFDSCATLN